MFCRITALSLALSSILGCAASQYIPESLKGTPKTELVRIKQAAKKIRNIDGIDCSFSIWAGTDVYITTGTHNVTLVHRSASIFERTHDLTFAEPGTYTIYDVHGKAAKQKWEADGRSCCGDMEDYVDYLIHTQ